jgi:hypothetical protein
MVVSVFASALCLLVRHPSIAVDPRSLVCNAACRCAQSDPAGADGEAAPAPSPLPDVGLAATPGGGAAAAAAGPLPLNDDGVMPFYMLDAYENPDARPGKGTVCMEPCPGLRLRCCADGRVTAPSRTSAQDSS